MMYSICTLYIYIYIYMYIYRYSLSLSLSLSLSDLHGQLLIAGRRGDIYHHLLRLQYRQASWLAVCVFSVNNIYYV